MRPVDYSPPAAPSLDQQRDALRKGLGRAMQWALAGRLDDQPLLEACLCDQRFDTQVDDVRGEWLWSLLQATGTVNRFRVPILHALYELADDRSIAQLCQLARHYAQAGDDAFRSRLYEIVERRPVGTSPELGEEDIVLLDGAQGFLFAACVRGASLASREWEWDDDALIDFARQRLGQEQADRLLQASTDEVIRRFHERWRQAQESRTPPSRATHRDQMRAIPVAEVLRAADSDSARGWFIGWGMHADEPALRTVVAHVWLPQPARVVCNLLRVFTRRGLPEFDARLIDLCRHGDENIRARAFRALRHNAHPMVRQFALDELRPGLRDGAVAGLFLCNYQRGDEHRLLEAMDLPEDDCQLHWLLMDLLIVLEKNSQADPSRLATVIYALTPCENCRFRAARLLVEGDAAPGWMRDECRYDSAQECRTLAGANSPGSMSE